MTPESLECIKKTIKTSCGGLANWQSICEQKLKDTKGTLLQDPEFVQLIAELASMPYYQHTGRWRDYLQKHWRFEFHRNVLGHSFQVKYKGRIIVYENKR